jgi:uncharacterized repeat protein (TIGR03837 family)
VRVHELPWLDQRDYDRLLWSCALNFVRGEDSFVRAQWAGAPFVWHIYPQHDGVHAAKLEAFLERHLARAPGELAREIAAWMRGWNGLTTELPPLPDLAAWADHTRCWREDLRSQPDLVTRLLAFIAEKR